jgi:Cu/Ag efflux protein CusF
VNFLGLLDLLAWAEASKASNNAKDAIQKIDALEKKVDLIAKKLDELESYLKAQH